MSELSADPRERSRKALAMLLQAMQDPGAQKALALTLGTSESTVSRIKTEKLEDALALIYQLGFRVVACDRVCVDASRLETVLTAAHATFSTLESLRDFVLEGD